jgi:hypothetical protein
MSKFLKNNLRKIVRWGRRILQPFPKVRFLVFLLFQRLNLTSWLLSLRNQEHFEINLPSINSEQTKPDTIIEINSPSADFAQLESLSYFGAEHEAKLQHLYQPEGRIMILGELLMSIRSWFQKVELVKSNKGMNVPLSKFSEVVFDENSLVRSNSEVNQVRAVVLCSLYKSDEFLDTFLGNMINQTIFDALEFRLYVVMATDYERKLVTTFAERYQNVGAYFSEDLTGIYEAWNWCIQNSTAPFLTNANADDLRRADSFEIQVMELEQNKWIDVVYQDVLYTLDRSLSWEAIEAIGYRSKFGPVSVGSLMGGFNYPHNAPMWRRSLHDEFGFFDEELKSAGDYDFWLRVALGGKIFYKTRQYHVAYYINPDGMSTRAAGPGVLEGALVQARFRTLTNSKNYGSKIRSGFRFLKSQSTDEILYEATLNELSSIRNGRKHV